MLKLMDICGLVDYDITTRKYDESKSIYGSLLVDEQSNYFEGFVRTYNETNSFLVFGTFNVEDGLHIYRCNQNMQEPKEMFIKSSKKIKNNPNSKRKDYFKYSAPGMKVIIQDGNIIREITNGEILLLQAKIKEMKKDCNLEIKSIQKINKK